jgi:hypothetical protein
MSMRDYAVDDYGIIIGEDEFAYMSEHYDGEGDKSCYYDVLEDLAEYNGEFTGEAHLINEDGTTDYGGRNTLSFSDDATWYFSIPKWGTLFKVAYNNMDELVQDMKEKYGKYLPPDYDYIKNIRHIIGTYYG